jgi:hypothetical protein
MVPSVGRRSALRAAFTLPTTASRASDKAGASALGEEQPTLRAVSASELVDRGLERMGSVNHWMSGPQLRALDEVKAILGAPDDLRRECIFELTERSTGPE